MLPANLQELHIVKHYSLERKREREGERVYCILDLDLHKIGNIKRGGDEISVHKLKWSDKKKGSPRNENQIVNRTVQDQNIRYEVDSNE